MIGVAIFMKIGKSVLILSIFFFFFHTKNVKKNENGGNNNEFIKKIADNKKIEHEKKHK